MTHLLVDISAHGFGHLGQTAPVLNALPSLIPDLHVTVRSGLPTERLALRIDIPFRHIREPVDFGYVMHNAIDLDLPATARRYREFHSDWCERVSAEADWQRASGFDAVLSNIAYLPLAGAAQAGIPAVAMCSLNWSDLFADNFGLDGWAGAVHAQMVAAYHGADIFLRITPGLPMAGLRNLEPIGPICRMRWSAREALAERLNIARAATWLLIAMGGMDFPINLAHWPRHAGVCYLVPGDIAVDRDDVVVFDRQDIDFTELLASVDVVVTKPGYGTFVEAACHGRPVLYVSRENWAEAADLEAWLLANARACVVSRNALLAGDFSEPLNDLGAQPEKPIPQPTGIAQAVAAIADVVLRGYSR